MSVSAARLLGIGSRFVGKPGCSLGYAADLIAVDGNPLADLSALRSIALVAGDGWVIREKPPQPLATAWVTGTRRYTGLIRVAGAGRRQPAPCGEGQVITVSGTTATDVRTKPRCARATHLGQTRICLAAGTTRR